MNAPLETDEAHLSVQHGCQKRLPPQGHLATLPTKAEVEARFKPIQAFITTVSAQSASKTLKAVDNALREAHPVNAQPLHHLRRFVKIEHLPEHLKNGMTMPPFRRAAEALLGLEEQEDRDKVTAITSGEPRLHLLVCATTDLALEHIRTLLGPDGLSTGKTIEPLISTITVPGLPPTSEGQAARWSRQYWPTIYKKHNPFGAHPAIISRAAAEIKENVSEYMKLARKVGREASDASVGENIGVVVVDRSKAYTPNVIMVAGDARWNLTSKRPAQEGSNGNVMAHAVMRAIGLVANKRQEVLSYPPVTRNKLPEDAFTDQPLTPLEKEAYAKSSIEPGGYLCLDLEFYLTHEPCVMCSMALLHSRAGRAIFGQRMLLTGGLGAGGEEGQAQDAQGLGYGLFWRPSLNWKFLTWQWSHDDPSSPSRFIDEKTHA